MQVVGAEKGEYRRYRYRQLQGVGKKKYRVVCVYVHVGFRLACGSPGSRFFGGYGGWMLSRVRYYVDTLWGRVLVRR